MKQKKRLLKKVSSLTELENLASTDERYAKLAVAGAGSIAGSLSEWRGKKKGPDLAVAMRVLRLNALEMGEKSVVAEVNFVRYIEEVYAPEAKEER